MWCKVYMPANVLNNVIDTQEELEALYEWIICSESASMSKENQASIMRLVGSVTLHTPMAVIQGCPSE